MPNLAAIHGPALPAHKQSRMLELEPSSIEALISEARAGSRDAFDQLVQLRIGVIEHTCAGIANNSNDCQIAISNTLYEAWKSIEGLRGESVYEFDAWLRTIARRSTNALYSAQQQRERKELIDSSDIDIDLRLHQSHENLVVDRIALGWALEQINPNYAQALILHEILGFKYEEIAEIQCVSVDTVKSRIFRSKQALAVLLEANRRD